jgi:hypothetical protein
MRIIEIGSDSASYMLSAPLRVLCGSIRSSYLHCAPASLREARPVPGKQLQYNENEDGTRTKTMKDYTAENELFWTRVIGYQLTVYSR